MSYTFEDAGVDLDSKIAVNDKKKQYPLVFMSI